jgi:hypothetical protein
MSARPIWRMLSNPQGAHPDVDVTVRALTSGDTIVVRNKKVPLGASGQFCTDGPSRFGYLAGSVEVPRGRHVYARGVPSGVASASWPAATFGVI